MIAGKMICNDCGKDVTGGLWAFILGSRGTLNGKQQQQLAEFKEKFGVEQLVWCWECIAVRLGAKSVKEAKAGEAKEQKKPDLPEKKDETKKT